MPDAEIKLCKGDPSVSSLFADPAAYKVWAERWRQRLSLEAVDATTRRAAMLAVNPAFIPRNHRVEAVIKAATERSDFRPFEELLDVLARPFEDQPALAHYADPPQPHEQVLRTFCGT